MEKTLLGLSMVISIKRGLFYKETKWYYSNIFYDYSKEFYFIGPAKNKKILTTSEVDTHIINGHTQTVIDKLSKTPPLRTKHPVAVVDDLGAIIRAYESILAAGNDTGADRSEISRCASGKTKKAKGLKFIYLTIEQYLQYLKSKQ